MFNISPRKVDSYLKNDCHTVSVFCNCLVVHEIYKVILSLNVILQ